MHALNMIVWTSDPWKVLLFGSAMGFALGAFLVSLLFDMGDRDE
jgi:hypothetical protein